MLMLLALAQELVLAPIHLTQFWGAPSYHPQEEGATGMRAELGIFHPQGCIQPCLRLLYPIFGLTARSHLPLWGRAAAF